MQIVSSRQFNHDVGRMKKVSLIEPVIITDRGKPSHVLLSINEYKKLTGSSPKISELLSMRTDDYVDISFPRLADLPKVAVFD
jgi:prevent-host-death family protein